MSNFGGKADIVPKPLTQRAAKDCGEPELLRKPCHDAQVNILSGLLIVLSGAFVRFDSVLYDLLGLRQQEPSFG